MPLRTIILLAALALAGCSRSFPTSFPAGSAASARSAEAEPLVVGRALIEEPPLPGEEREGWEALDRGEREPAHGHHGHHGHGGHQDAR